MLIQLALQDPVISKTDVTSSRCDRLAHMTHFDDLSTFGRPFQTTRYVELEYIINKVRYPYLPLLNRTYLFFRQKRMTMTKSIIFDNKIFTFKSLTLSKYTGSLHTHNFNFCQIKSRPMLHR